uniref:Transposase n=1 Tax=Neogobius melanostomus TaxID=47308 RepID=A0A8C6SRI9_9GOBI
MDNITNKNLFDMLQKMSVDMEDLKTIKKTMTSVEEKLSGLVNRITEVEERVSGIEDTLAKQKENPAVSKEEWRTLRDKLALMEDRSRRNNLRFVGFDEGSEQRDAAGFLNRFITTAVTDVDFGNIKSWVAFGVRHMMAI